MKPCFADCFADFSRSGGLWFINLCQSTTSPQTAIARQAKRTSAGASRTSVSPSSPRSRVGPDPLSLSPSLYFCKSMPMALRGGCLLLFALLVVTQVFAQPLASKAEGIIRAGGVIEPMVGMFNVSCDVGACVSGKCRFKNCKDHISCDGGVCEFINCVNATCKGGLCRFIDSYHSTCDGGNCKFHRPRHTLRDGYCKGGVCYLNGRKHPTTFKDRLSY